MSLMDPKEYTREKTGRLIPCDGEAHRNPMIDNCGLCAPRWGQVEELAPVDLDVARAAGLDVAVNDLSEEQDAAMQAARKRGEAKLVQVTRILSWGTRSYFVYRWMKEVAA